MTTNSPFSRSAELYALAMDKYQKFIDEDLGTSNALIAAIAEMVAAGEAKITWKATRLFEADTGEPEPIESPETSCESPSARQLSFNW